MQPSMRLSGLLMFALFAACVADETVDRASRGPDAAETVDAALNDAGADADATSVDLAPSDAAADAAMLDPLLVGTWVERANSLDSTRAPLAIHVFAADGTATWTRGQHTSGPLTYTRPTASA